MGFEYPAIVVGLEVQMLLAPRMLRDRQWGVSDPIDAARSVVAGSGHGASLGMVRLCPILTGARAVSPRSGPRSFVDDAVARAEGSKAELPRQLPKVGLALKGGLDEQELLGSSETKAVSADGDP